ncbi:MAG TPA: hypothetical protein VFL83_09000 [Anaeromyxobacter sp.]|nr:hypothetical protein [Anaeromyxobacter sp.]
MRNVKKNPTAEAGAAVPPDATMRFEVFHNGRRIARSGIPGCGVLSTTVSWARRDVRRFPPGADVHSRQLYFHVGGLDSNDPAWSRHVDWSTPALKLGDRIEIRLSDNPRLDPPAREQKYRNQKRPEPPASSDVGRTDIQGAILWPARSGAYLCALDPDNGGPVTLSPRNALRMAKALTRLAAGGRAPARRAKKGLGRSRRR